MKQIQTALFQAPVAAVAVLPAVSQEDARWEKRRTNRKKRDKKLQRRFVELYAKTVRINGKTARLRYDDIIKILADEFDMEESVVKRKMKG